MQTKRFLLIWLGFVTAVSAQNYFPKKDATFGQVVVGGGYETVINLANRGPYNYVGSLMLFRLEGAIWNPAVNGRTLQDGQLEIEIPPQATVTLRLTGSRLESGAAILRSDNLLLDNLIEANLTYLVRNNGRVTDSVGISPAKEFYRASIPFEKFTETALALANGDTTGEFTAEVELTLHSADGRRVGQPASITLGPLFHQARFLNEIFRGQSLAGGRLEIASDSPIFGTALTFAGGQFSSLPLEPAPVTYSVRLLTSSGAVATGEIALWADGLFIRGYMVISALDGEAFDDPKVSLVNGELENGEFRLAFTIFQDPFFGDEVTMSLGHDRFSFESNLVPGQWTMLFPNDDFLKGTYELRRQ